ncbi:MAG: nucleoside phosphorylase [Bacteroidota bacterium]|nr:nucleoside phosphorylase [Bacteroidota bacterium]
MATISETDLMINPDGSIFHLKLHPDQLANTIIIVGDPGRVPEVYHHFDSIEFTSANREFVSCTGMCKGKRITVLSTGIGTDNMDIVMNELDALANIDFNSRQPKSDRRSLKIIRVGTSGAIHADMPIHSLVLSSFGLGFDNLIHFYHSPSEMFEANMEEAFLKHAGWNPLLSRPYIVKGSEELLNIFADIPLKGITATTPGFYAPQGRSLRLAQSDPKLFEKIRKFQHEGWRITNFEMETSALYGLSRLLGHRAVTVCVLLANRATHEYSRNHNEAIQKLIEYVLGKLTPD